MKVVVVMIAKPFSVNTHSNKNGCKRNSGSMERRVDTSAEEIVRHCEETENLCVFIDTWGAQLHKIVTGRGHTVDPLEFPPTR